MSEKYSVVILNGNGKEVGRSVPMEFGQAFSKVRKIAMVRKKHNILYQLAYVEEAASVKHLPIKTNEEIESFIRE